MSKLFLAILLIVCAFQAYGIDYLVEFKSKPHKGLVESLKHQKGVLKLERFDSLTHSYFSRIYYLSVNRANHSILKSPIFKNVESIYQTEVSSLTPGRASFSQDSFSHWQWNLYHQGQSVLQDIDDINSLFVQGDSSFDLGLFSLRQKLPSLLKKDIVVAVIDSGVDLDHEDLKPNIFRNAPECKNGELPFGLLTDKDGNGLAGDCMGWNFVNNNNRPYDDKGHGTHVAGIIAAVSDNGKGISGILPGGAPRIKILPIKVYQGSENMQGATLGAFTDKITKGILYAAKMKVDVINLSMGWPRVMDTEYLRQAVAFARAQGITVVAAAGNNGHSRPLFPCSYEGVICVGASSVDGSSASFSNYGGHVDLLAPGEQILSTFPKKLEPTFFSAQGYELKNGTSQAAPFVSSIVAILRSIYPHISENELLYRLISTTKRPNLKSEKYFLSGLVNLEAALNVSFKPYLLPNFKKLTQVVFRMGDSGFTFELELKNLGPSFEGGRLCLDNQNADVELTNACVKLESWEKDQVQKITFSGVIKETDADAHWDFGVIIDTAEQQSVFKHEVLFVRDLVSDNAVKKIVLNDAGLVNEISVLMKDGLLSRLRTIDEPARTSSHPQYFYDRINPTTKELELWIFKKEGDRFSPHKIIVPNANKVGGVRLVDLNFDDRLDYFVESKGIVSQENEAKIIYSFISSEFIPLIGKGHFSYSVKEAYAPIQKMSFISLNTAEGRFAFPVFIEQGHIPNKDKNPDVWQNESNILRTHAYYFMPDLSTHSFDLRMIDNYVFEKRLLEECQKKWDEDYSFVGVGGDGAKLFNQNLNEQKNGMASFVFSVGYPNQRRYYEGHFKDGELAIKKLNTTSYVEESDIRLPLIQITGSEVDYSKGSAYASLQNQLLAKTVFKDGEKIKELRFDHADKRDSIISPLAAFDLNGSFLSYYQTKGNLVRQSSSGQQTVYPIERVSFVTGQAFSELYYPLVQNGKVSFYVDATKLYLGHLFVIKDSSEGFFSPMKSNVFIPKNCAPMNPVKYDNTESFSYVCREGNTLVMNFLSLD